jgi:hypothetical protein
MVVGRITGPSSSIYSLFENRGDVLLCLSVARGSGDVESADNLKRAKRASVIRTSLVEAKQQVTCHIHLSAGSTVRS